jgi:hypothetical protein
MTKYTVSRRVIVAQTTDGPLMDIVFDELTEHELLLALLKDPAMTYYAKLDDGTVNFYSQGELYAVNNQRVNRD